MACRDIHEVRHLGVLMGYCDHQMHRLMTKSCGSMTYLPCSAGR